MAQSEKQALHNKRDKPTWPPELTVPMQAVQRAAEPKLESLGFSWQRDVEDVYPIAGSFMSIFMKMYLKPHKLVYVTSLREVSQLQQALMTSLESWPLFRSIAVEPSRSVPLVINLRPSQHYFDRAISVHDEVSDEQALMDITGTANYAASQLPRDLLFRIVIASIARTKTMGFILMVDHAIIDAHTIISWCHDVVSLIAKSSVPSRVPYRAFADIHQSLSTSMAASKATEFHVKRLQGIGDMRHALWPPLKKNKSVVANCVSPWLQVVFALLKAKLRMNRASSNSGYDNVAKTSAVPKEAVEGGGYCNGKYIDTRQFPNLSNFHAKHRIRVSTIFKAAVSLYNVQRTAASQAIFGMALSGRAWPFLDGSLASLLPSAWNIAGRTLTSVLEIVKLDWEETFEQLLRRMDME